MSENTPVKLSDLQHAIQLPFESIDDASESLKKEYQNLLSLGDNTFGQSKFSEKHFVLGEQMLPHRTYRQAMLHYDNKRHALAEAQATKARTAAKLIKIEGDLKLLNMLRSRIEKAEQTPENLPEYSCEIYDHDKLGHLEFKPSSIISFYTPLTWPECKEHLLTELDTILVVKRAEASQLKRVQFQQQKLEKDAVSDIQWYETEILPKAKEAVEASIRNGIDFEKEEEIYWQLRFKRDIESRQIELATGLPHDYIQSISQLPETMASNLIEFAKENYDILKKTGLPNTMRYKKHAVEACNALTSGSLDDVKQLTVKEQANRNSLGTIFMGLLFRNEEDAKQHGASDPYGSLYMPRGYNVEPMYVWGMRTDEARNLVVQKALEMDADWVFFVDDDVILPKTALNDLLTIATTCSWPVVAGDYPLKKQDYESASIVYTNVDDKGVAISPVLEDENGEPVISKLLPQSSIDKCMLYGCVTDAVQINAIIASGCLLIKTSVLRQMGGDWFKEYRRNLNTGVSEIIRTDDAPFTTRCIEMNIIPRLIPSIKCQHVDMKTCRVYGKKRKDVDYVVNNRMNPFIDYNNDNFDTKRITVNVPRRSLGHVPYVALDKLARPKCTSIAVPEAPIGMSWVDAWNSIVKTSISNHVDYIVIIEDDMLVPRNAVSHLLQRIQNSDFSFICGSYVRKDSCNESVHITNVGTTLVEEPIQYNDLSGQAIDGMTRTVERMITEPLVNPYQRRGLVENNFLTCFGCCIIDTKVFANLPFPWFYYAEPGNVINFQDQKTEIQQTITHDAFFTRRLLKAGFKSAVDTDLQCLHVDLETKNVYGSPEYVTPVYSIKQSALKHFAVDHVKTKELCIAFEE